ncbi:MAG: ABC transporter permease [Candidatus Dormibacteria bacterium]
MSRRSSPSAATDVPGGSDRLDILTEFPRHGHRHASRGVLPKPISRWWRSFKALPGLEVVAYTIAAGWLVVTVLGPVIAPYSPVAETTNALAGPSAAHFFGTDELGRDVFSRILWGAQITIPYSLLVVALAVLIGSVVGVIAGYFGGWVDEILMRVVDLVFAFPSIILAMAIAAALGPSIGNAVVAVVVVSWPAYARVVRSLVIGAMHSDFVLAARLLGPSSLRAMAVDVLPNVVGPTVVYATLGLGEAMLVLVGLSFLGLGAQPPAPEWGLMISDAQQYYDHWWLALFPGLCIMSVVFCLNIAGDRVRDLLDPRMSTA